jgi:transposase
VFAATALADLHHELADHYSHIGRPSIDPELLVRMRIVGYCYGIRSERRLCEEVADRLTFRWVCRMDLDDNVPDHSTFSKNRHGRFRNSDVMRHIFERVVLDHFVFVSCHRGARLRGRSRPQADGAVLIATAT